MDFEKSEQFLIQKNADQEERNAIPEGVNKPANWCTKHECKYGTCFPIHNPLSQASIINDTGA